MTDTVNIVFFFAACAFTLYGWLANAFYAWDNRQAEIKSRRDLEAYEAEKRRAAAEAYEARKANPALKAADEAVMRHFRSGLSVAKAFELASAETEAGVP